MNTLTPTPLNGATALPHLGFIRAQGPDAALFLHGQLTNDFSVLDVHHARLAGYCSPKGRLLASFVGWKRTALGDDILLQCHANLLTTTHKRLSMFVMRAQCKLTDASAEFQQFGLAGPSAEQWLGTQMPARIWDKTDIDQATVVRLPNAGASARFLWVAPVKTPAPELSRMEVNTWHWGDVQSAVAHIEAATADQFVPQMLNYELVQAVDFKKGCYPGQEVVARSQYRGTTKRRSLLFACDAQASIGQEIFHSEDPGQPAGMVLNAAQVTGQPMSLLAEIKLAALNSGSLHLGSATGPVIQTSPMPYDISQSATD
jgi:tRNA-modifying protein YgfZ